MHEWRQLSLINQNTLWHEAFGLQDFGVCIVHVSHTDVCHMSHDAEYAFWSSGPHLFMQFTGD